MTAPIVEQSTAIPSKPIRDLTKWLAEPARRSSGPVAVCSNNGFPVYGVGLMDRRGRVKYEKETLRFYYKPGARPIQTATTSQSAYIARGAGASYHFNALQLLGVIGSDGELFSFDIVFSRIGPKLKRYAGVVRLLPAARGARPNREALFPQDGRTYQVFHCTINGDKNATLLVGATSRSKTKLEAYNFVGTKLTRTKAAGPYKRCAGKQVPAEMDEIENPRQPGKRYRPTLVDVGGGKAVYTRLDGVIELDIATGRKRTLSLSGGGFEHIWYLRGRLFVTRTVRGGEAWSFSPNNERFSLWRAQKSGTKWDNLGNYRILGSSANEKYWIYQDGYGKIYLGRTDWLIR
ncbi:MAG: hypothetical protein ACR2HJ_07515 [Fimbriimonadales bacterium]